jgi:tetratricopeptide (TPR) repeat protein
MLAVLLVVSISIYSNVFKNDFVGYDDQNLIQGNRAIRSLSPGNIAEMFVPRTRGNYQPIRTLSSAIDYALWGARPFGFHLTNIILHAATVIGVWLLIRRLLPEPVPWLAAIIFAVHPIHVESVAWMSARKDVLSLTFFLLAVLLYERSESNGKPAAYAGSIIATGLALLSKLTAVSIPLCILLLEICRDGRPKAVELRRKVIRLLPHFLLIGLILVLNFVRVGPTFSHGDAVAGLAELGRPIIRDTWLSMPLVICRYISLLFLPYRLSTHYDVTRFSEFADVRVLIPIAFLSAAISLGAICYVRDRKAVAFCIGWSVITFLPTSNIFPTVAMMTDRYMHIPSIGFAALLAMALTWPARRISRSAKPTVYLLALFPAVAVVLFFSLLTLRRNTDWRDTNSLFTRTLLVSPRSVDARLALGTMHHEMGDYDSAIKMYRDALCITPGQYRVLYNLAGSYMKKGWIHQATEALEESRASNPEFQATHFNLALAYHQQKRYEEAIAELEEVLRISPDHALAHGNLGRIHVEMGEHELALGQLNRALGIRPDLIPALVDRAGLLMRLGQYEEAEQDVRRLQSLGADTRDLEAGLSDAAEKAR